MVADSLLKQLYHWVSNPSSAVHHPLLHQALLGLMQRLFVLLLDEMGKLGARVVAADFGSVLIYTGKRNLTAAGAQAAAVQQCDFGTCLRSVLCLAYVLGGHC
jgi:hypothetical protein